MNLIRLPIYPITSFTKKLICFALAKASEISIVEYWSLQKITWLRSLCNFLPRRYSLRFVDVILCKTSP